MKIPLNKGVTTGLGIVLVILIPLVVRDRFLVATLIESGIWCLFAIGFAAVFRVGQISMGQAAFMSIGGYTAGLMSADLGLSIWLTLPAAGVAAGLVACLLGLVVLRIGGLYFAIATLAFGEIITIISRNWSAVTQGPTGIALPVPDDISVGGLVISFSRSALPFYYLTAALVAVAAVIFWRIDRSRQGRITRSVAENDILSEHLGMHLMKYRVIMFTLGAFFTGVGGALYVHYLYWEGPPLFTGAQSFAVMMMCVVGGINSSVVGPVLGAILLTVSGTYMGILFEGLRPLSYGLLVLAVIWLLPNGMMDMKSLLTRLGRGNRSEVPLETRSCRERGGEMRE